MIVGQSDFIMTHLLWRGRVPLFMKRLLVYSLMLNWDDGVTSRVGQLERPFILFENGEPAYMFLATSDGIGSFKEMSASWNMVIPFVKK